MALGFTIVPEGPFSIELAAGFGFGPRSGEGDGRLMRLAFAVDGLREQAGVVLRQDPDGMVGGEVDGVEDGGLEAVRCQVSRILSLDYDGAAWLRVGERDAVIRRLQTLYPGLRPVLFHSPYEAAAWAVISARRPAVQGARTRAAVAERLGESFDIAGERVAAFPAPERLLAVEPMPGLPEVKAERLRA